MIKSVLVAASLVLNFACVGLLCNCLLSMSSVFGIVSCLVFCSLLLLRNLVICNSILLVLLGHCSFHCVSCILLISRALCFLFLLGLLIWSIEMLFGVCIRMQKVMFVEKCSICC